MFTSMKIITKEPDDPKSVLSQDYKPKHPAKVKEQSLAIRKNLTSAGDCFGLRSKHRGREQYKTMSDNVCGSK